MAGMIIQPMNTTADNTVGTLPPSFSMHGVVRLPHLGVIQAQGDDAVKFLHGQLTQDFSLLDLHTARLAALCSPKGRMLASFIGFKRAGGEVLLVCHQDLLAQTLKRLCMFVLRAKVKLSDASDQFALYGLLGDTTKTIAEQPTITGAKADLEQGTLINLHPAGTTPRQLWLCSTDSPAPAGPSATLDAWLWGEVRSGVATLSAAVVEAFVPQMLNYESVGGVNFKKGCYPGQEVVARSQFRGTLKRRTYLVHSPVALKAGDPVFSPTDPEQPAGTVVQAAVAPQGGFDALVSLQVAAVEGGTLHVEGVQGPTVTLLELPYALLEDI